MNLKLCGLVMILLYLTSCFASQSKIKCLTKNNEVLQTMPKAVRTILQTMVHFRPMLTLSPDCKDREKCSLDSNALISLILRYYGYSNLNWEFDCNKRGIMHANSGLFSWPCVKSLEFNPTNKYLSLTLGDESTISWNLPDEFVKTSGVHKSYLSNWGYVDPSEVKAHNEFADAQCCLNGENYAVTIRYNVNKVFLAFCKAEKEESK